MKKIITFLFIAAVAICAVSCDAFLDEVNDFECTVEAEEVISSGEDYILKLHVVKASDPDGRFFDYFNFFYDVFFYDDVSREYLEYPDAVFYDHDRVINQNGEIYVNEDGIIELMVPNLPVGMYRFDIMVVHGDVVKKEKLRLEVKDNKTIIPVDA